MWEAAIDKHYIKNHPQFNNPNWIRVGYIKYLCIYPIKWGGSVSCNSFRYNHNGMIKDSGNQTLWDGMYFLYNQQTKQILHWSNTHSLSTISVVITNDGSKLFSCTKENLNNLYLTPENIEENSRIFYYSSWHTGIPLKLIDYGDEAAEWINKSLEIDAPVRLLQRSCDPFIEESNIIRENWINYYGIYSNKSDQKPEMFADLMRCVLMTTITSCTLLHEAKSLHESLSIRPNIIVSTNSKVNPYNEEDWEWIKIRNTIIRIIKPVPKYHIVSDSTFHRHFIEDDIAHLGMYCAPIVSGDIKEKDDVYVYHNPNSRIGPFYYDENLCV